MSARTPRAARLAAPIALLLAAVTAGTPAGASQRACGSGWAVMPSPTKGAATLSAVAATSRTNVWAVGTYNSAGAYKTLIERWNGSRWAIVPSPNSGRGEKALLGASARSSTDIWAVGYRNDPGNRPAASPGADYNSLQAIATASSSNAWAVGARRATPGSAFRTLTEHWNGKAWTVAASPSPGRGNDTLFGVARVPGRGGYWAVGTAGDKTLTEFRC